MMAPLGSKWIQSGQSSKKQINKKKVLASSNLKNKTKQTNKQKSKVGNPLPDPVHLNITVLIGTIIIPTS